MSAFDQFVLPIFQNLALLLAVALLVILLRDGWCRYERFSSQVIFGLLFAVAAVVASLMPVSATIGPDTGIPNLFLRVDLILLLLAGVLVGPVAGALALLICVLFEILPAMAAGMLLSPDVLTPDLLALLFCGVLGLFAVRWWTSAGRAGRTALLVMLALAGAAGTSAVNLQDLAVFEPLPPEFILQYAGAVAVTFLIGALLLGRVLMWEADRRAHERALEVVRASRDASATGILWVASDGAILFANESATAILGFSEEEFRRRHMRDLDTSSSDQESSQRRLSPQAGAWPRIFEARLKNRQDVSVLVEIAANRVDPGEYGEPFTVIGLRQLGRRTELAALPGATTTVSAGAPTGSGVGTAGPSAAPPVVEETRTNIDSLTNLGDREMMERTGREMALRAARREMDNMVLAVVDVDDLEGFNERRGFAMGDALLQSYARILRQSLRADDRAFRFGGDEFAVLMPGRGEGAFDYLRGRFDDMIDMVKGAGFPDAEATCGFAALSEVNYDIHKAIRLAGERVMEAKPPYLRARHARGEKGEE